MFGFLFNMMDGGYFCAPYFFSVSSISFSLISFLSSHSSPLSSLQRRHPLLRPWLLLLLPQVAVRGLVSPLQHLLLRRYDGWRHGRFCCHLFAGQRSDRLWQHLDVVTLLGGERTMHRVLVVCVCVCVCECMCVRMCVDVWMCGCVDVFLIVLSCICVSYVLT